MLESVRTKNPRYATSQLEYMEGVGKTAQRIALVHIPTRTIFFLIEHFFILRMQLTFFTDLLVELAIFVLIILRFHYLNQWRR